MIPGLTRHHLADVRIPNIGPDNLSDLLLDDLLLIRALVRCLRGMGCSSSLSFHLEHEVRIRVWMIAADVADQAVLLDSGVLTLRTFERFLMRVAVTNMTEECVVLEGPIVAVRALMRFRLVRMAAPNVESQVAFLGCGKVTQMATVRAFVGVLGADVNVETLLPACGEAAVLAGIRLGAGRMQVTDVTREIAPLS